MSNFNEETLRAKLHQYFMGEGVSADEMVAWVNIYAENVGETPPTWICSKAWDKEIEELRVKVALNTLCDQLDKMPRRKIKDSQTHSYIAADNVEALVEQARMEISDKENHSNLRDAVVSAKNGVVVVQQYELMRLLGEYDSLSERKKP